MNTDLGRIRVTIFSARLPPSVESKMQAAIAERLTAAGIEHARELNLAKFGRIDFAIRTKDGYAGFECKTHSSAMAAARQLHRYGQSGKFDILVLITARPYQLPISHVQHGTRQIPVLQWQIPAL